jgi:DNA-binding HxlR family transcriptional regulator
MAKSYDQFCPIAHALDVVGERWALLVVRELQHGPLRYSDIHERLHGCSTNILAARLRDLEANGVVGKRRLPPPAASTVYELTEHGRGLAPVLSALAYWGARTLGPPDAEHPLERGWLERALRTAVSPLVSDARVSFACEDEHASLLDGTVERHLADDVDAHVEGDQVGLFRLLVDGDLDAVRIDGDRDVVRRVAEAGRPVPAARSPVG